MGSTDVGFDILQWIPTLTDRYLKKCHVSYVPRLTSNTTYLGFTPSASSEFNSTYIAANAFNGDFTANNWSTAGIRTNFRIEIAYPSPVKTWKFGFRGYVSNYERILNWRIE